MNFPKTITIEVCEERFITQLMGDGYPSETFRVLKNKEMKEFSEYRTQRLVLEAWDKLEAEEL